MFERKIINQRLVFIWRDFFLRCIDLMDFLNLRFHTFQNAFPLHSRDCWHLYQVSLKLIEIDMFFLLFAFSGETKIKPKRFDGMRLSTVIE